MGTYLLHWIIDARMLYGGSRLVRDLVPMKYEGGGRAHFRIVAAFAKVQWNTGAMCVRANAATVDSDSEIRSRPIAKSNSYRVRMEFRSRVNHSVCERRTTPMIRNVVGLCVANQTLLTLSPGTIETVFSKTICYSNKHCRNG